MGILDNVLRPHLEAVTQFHRENKSLWMSSYESSKTEEINFEENAKLKRLRLNKLSEQFREQGNQFFKAQDFGQAHVIYTKSIAAALEGPLASLAYFNRLIC
jgi:hypothetical protein